MAEKEIKAVVVKQLETIEDLRQMLLEEMTSVRQGKMAPHVFQALVNGVGKVTMLTKLEMEYYKIAGMTHESAFIKALDKIAGPKHIHD